MLDGLKSIKYSGDEGQRLLIMMFLVKVMNQKGIKVGYADNYKNQTLFT